MADNLDALYRIVGDELTRGFQTPGPLARAVAEGLGDGDLTRSLYVNYRVRELLEQVAAAARQSEERAREERRSLVERHGFYPNTVEYARTSTPGFDLLSLERKIAVCKAAESAKLLYQGAHDAHYQQFDLAAATKGYRRLTESYPQFDEARWAKEQLANIDSMTLGQRAAYQRKFEAWKRSR